MTIKEVKAYRKEAKANFDGNERLFNACWNTYISYLGNAIDNPSDTDAIDNWLDSIALDKESNPRSVFYI